MKLNKLIKNINYLGNPDDREILNITHDSRKVKEGTLFIAIPGNNNDGHDFIFDAIDKGAIAVIANGRSPVTDKVPIIQVKNPRRIMSEISAEFYRNPSKNLNMIGVTGTNGKTTTTQLIDFILKGIISTGFTTPESIELQQILKTLYDGGINYVPMEVSSHSIDMHRVDNVEMNLALFTNLTIDHLDFHGTMENYFHSKLKLFTNLKEDALAIINADDGWSSKIIERIKSSHVTYGIDNKADLKVTNYSLHINYSQIEFSYKNNIYNTKTNLIGKFNIYNCISAILCCLEIGLDFDNIKNALLNFESVPGRIEKFNLINDNIAIVDYAHTPDAYQNILSTIKEICIDKKIITIFGCGGNRDKSKRPLMAKIAEQHSQHVYVTTDNPRNEDENNIINDILEGFDNANHTIIKNRKDAIENVIKNNRNAVIVVLGKGRENYQIIKNKKIYHSDIEIIEKYLDENHN